jgi:NADPH:quinone reductase-like Zn-dependent oxidoreductase
VPNWQYPAILGSDASGTVAAVGGNVSGFNGGDRVFFQSGYGDDNVSTFQEFTTPMVRKLAIDWGIMVLTHSF